MSAPWTCNRRSPGGSGEPRTMPRKVASPSSDVSSSQLHPVSRKDDGDPGPRLIALTLIQEIEMVGGTLAVSDGQAVADGLGEIGLGGLNGIGDGFPPGDMRRDG